VPQDQIQPVLLIECPRLLFPFARSILADASRDGGFPPLMLGPVDFVAMYQRQMEAAAAESGGGDGSTPPVN
jgi:preprotein translocase subunit SecB